MLQHTESLIGMETELNMETALKKSKAECIELRRIIIIPRGGFPAPSLVLLLLGFSGVVTRKAQEASGWKQRMWDSAPSRLWICVLPWSTDDVHSGAWGAVVHEPLRLRH